MNFAVLTLAVLALSSVQVHDTLDVARISQPRNIATASSAPVQRVSSVQMQRQGAVTLTEALGSFAGVRVVDYGGIGGLKTVNIRNFGSAHTGVYYDGVVISNIQNGQVDIGRFNIEDLESVVVDISGSDDIFRSARLCTNVGTMQLTSARPVLDSSATSVSVRMRYGSFNTYNPYVSLKQRLCNGWSAGLWADYLNSRGEYPYMLRNSSLVTREIRINSDVESLNTALNVWGDMGDRGDLNIKLSYYGSSRGLPGSVVLYTPNDRERLWDRDISASSLYDVGIGSQWRLKTSLSYVSRWNRWVNDWPSFRDDDRYHQQEGALSMVGLWSPGPYLSVSIAEDMTVNTLGSNLPHCFFPLRLGSYTALSCKYENARLTAVATVLGTIVGEQSRGEGADMAGSSDGSAPLRWRISPSLSASYRLLHSENLRIRASLRESYRLPTFNDLYYPRIGNRSLNPEKAYQSNFGLAWDRECGDHFVSLSCDGYFNMVKDKIVAVPSMFIWSMRNVGKVLMSGADVSALYKGRICGWLTLDAKAGYSYQYAVDVTDPDAKNYGHQIAYTPRHSGNACVILEFPWMNLGYTLNAAGERYSLAQNVEDYRLEPFADHSLSLNGCWTFGRRHSWRLDASLDARNLAGKNYEIIKYYPMMGRNYRLTVKITY